MTPDLFLPGVPAGRLRVVRLAPHPRPTHGFVELTDVGDIVVGSDDGATEPWTCTGQGLRWAVPAELEQPALARLLEAAMPHLEALQSRLEAFHADRLNRAEEADFAKAVG